MTASDDMMEIMITESLDEIYTQMEKANKSFNLRQERNNAEQDLPVRLTTEEDDLFSLDCLIAMKRLGVDTEPANQEVERGLVQRAYDFFKGQPPVEYASIQMEGDIYTLNDSLADLAIRGVKLLKNVTHKQRQFSRLTMYFGMKAQDPDEPQAEMYGKLYGRTLARRRWLREVSSAHHQWERGVHDRFKQVFKTDPAPNVYRPDLTVN